MTHNWNGRRIRSRMWRNGSENAREAVPIMRPLSRRRAPAPAISKTVLRQETAAALALFKGTVTVLPTVVPLTCSKCGHRGKARVQPGQQAPRFRCSRCGAKNDGQQHPR